MNKPRYILCESYIVMGTSGHITVDFHPENAQYCCDACPGEDTCEHIEFVKEYIRDKFVMLDSIHRR